MPPLRPRPGPRRKRIKQRQASRRPALSEAFGNSTVLETVFLVGLVTAAAIVVWTYQFISSRIEDEDERRLPQVHEPQRLAEKQPLLRGNMPDKLDGRGDTPGQLDDRNRRGGFERYSKIAQDLAALSPSGTLERLKRDDPFGTEKFDAALLERETTLGRVLTIDEIEQLFPCPGDEERITLPDFRVEQKARDFREEKKGTFLFFQHLRKAGGTNFCSLAEANLPRKAQPRYYCMPDMGWSGNKNAGYLHSWPNDEIIKRMASSGFRIAGNEWENFDPSRHFDLPAVFATSFRKPLDRALSQFRFECIEDRGCKIKDVHKWWEKRTDLYNIYVNMHTPIQSILTVLPVQSKHLRTQLLGPELTLTAKREDGQDENKLGSASIKKASWVPEEYLDADQYKKMSEDLALDEILTQVARRMFLERLVCKDLGGGVAIEQEGDDD
ncbi:hypothetical protein ACHAWF_015836 [Thalassiosira exigua]